MSDLELDRTVATNWQEYKTEFLRMKDMVVWVWKDLVSREGRAFMRRMIGWMALSCVLTVVLPLTFGRITDLLDPRRARVNDLLLMLGIYGVSSSAAPAGPVSPGHHARISCGLEHAPT
jgi:hypothetical protein